jgi:hypothetical protein
MSYQADATGQMREHGSEGPSDLRVHELRERDGAPLCGEKPASWHGRPMVLVRLGPGQVDCLSCARISGN